MTIGILVLACTMAGPFSLDAATLDALENATDRIELVYPNSVLLSELLKEVGRQASLNVVFSENFDDRPVQLPMLSTSVHGALVDIAQRFDVAYEMSGVSEISVASVRRLDNVSVAQYRTLGLLEGHGTPVTMNFERLELSRALEGLGAVGKFHVSVQEGCSGKSVSYAGTKQSMQDVLGDLAAKYGLVYEVSDPNILTVKCLQGAESK